MHDVDGDNPDARFGRWVSSNFGDTRSQRVREFRRLWEVFDERREEVAQVQATGPMTDAIVPAPLDSGRPGLHTRRCGRAHEALMPPDAVRQRTE